MTRPRLHKARGIIIRRRVIGEADRMLTLFTKELGKCTVIAKGIRRITSKRAPRLELLSHVDVFLYRGKTWSTVSDVTTIASFPRIGSSLAHMSVAYYLCELIDALLPADQEHEAVYDFMVAALSSLETLDEISLTDFQIAATSSLLRTLGYMTTGAPLSSLELRAFIERIIERKLKSYAFLTTNTVSA